MWNWDTLYLAPPSKIASSASIMCRCRKERLGLCRIRRSSNQVKSEKESSVSWKSLGDMAATSASTFLPVNILLFNSSHQSTLLEGRPLPLT